MRQSLFMFCDYEIQCIDGVSGRGRRRDARSGRWLLFSSNQLKARRCFVHPVGFHLLHFEQLLTLHEHAAAFVCCFGAPNTNLNNINNKGRSWNCEYFNAVTVLGMG